MYIVISISVHHFKPMLSTARWKVTFFKILLLLFIYFLSIHTYFSSHASYFFFLSLHYWNFSTVSSILRIVCYTVKNSLIPITSRRWNAYLHTYYMNKNFCTYFYTQKWRLVPIKIPYLYILKHRSTQKTLY